ncbi:MAG: hypothetical protein ACWA6R_01130 [Nitrosomonas sp.]
MRKPTLELKESFQDHVRAERTAIGCARLVQPAPQGRKGIG